MMSIETTKTQRKTYSDRSKKEGSDTSKDRIWNYTIDELGSATLS